MWDLDLRAGTFVWSKSHFRLLGYEPDPSGQGTPEMWRSRIHPDDLARVLAEFEQAKCARTPYVLQYRILRADTGEVAWLKAFGRSLYDETGEPVRMTGILFDCTEQKRLEKRQSLQSAVTRILAEAAEIQDAAPQIIGAVCETTDWDIGAVWQVDADETAMRCVGIWNAADHQYPEFESVTRALVLPLGVGLPGRVWADNGPAWIPDLSADGNFPRAPIAVREGLRCGVAFPIRRGSAVLGTVEFFTHEVRERDDALVHLLDAAGSQLGQFIERKRAEETRRRSEQRLSAIMSHIMDGIITIDDQGRIQSVNPAAERLFGYTKEELVGNNIGVIMPEPYRSQHDRYISSYKETGQAKVIGIGREVVGRRKDGSTFPLDLSVSEFDLAGKRFFTGSLRDITERKRTEEIMRLQNEQLEAADRRKDEFLAQLAHELRNPLAPIRNAVSVLRAKGPPVPELEWCRDIIDRQVGIMARLLEDLMDLSRLGQGKLTLRMEQFELSKAVRHAVEIAEPWIDAGKHRLSLSLPDQCVVVKADFVRLVQILMNLIQNAAKYSGSGSLIRLTVELGPRSADLVIRVRDTGIGIDPDMLAKVFEPFAQIGKANDRSRGLGIGLSLTRQLVELHGGTIEGRSEGRGKGSEFVLFLPIVLHTSASEPGSPPKPEQEPNGRYRVLVVDDLADSADSMAMALGARGQEALTAYSGEQALATAERLRPDVVVLDIGMPGMSGYEVARRIREQPWGKEMVLIALTGWGQDSNRRHSDEAGFDHHLVKPVDPADLFRLLESNGPSAASKRAIAPADS